MAQYKTNQKTFIAPHLLDEGVVFTIDKNWVPGPHVEPMDDEAKEAYEAMEKAREAAGHAPVTLHPAEALPSTVSSIDTPAAPAAPTLDLSLAEAAAGKGSPGPSDKGGSIAEKK